MVDLASVVELGDDSMTLDIPGGGAKVGEDVGWDVGCDVGANVGLTVGRDDGFTVEGRAVDGTAVG